MYWEARGRYQKRRDQGGGKPSRQPDSGAPKDRTRTPEACADLPYGTAAKPATPTDSHQLSLNVKKKRDTHKSGFDYVSQGGPTRAVLHITPQGSLLGTAAALSMTQMWGA